MNGGAQTMDGQSPTTFRSASHEAFSKLCVALPKPRKSTTGVKAQVKAGHHGAGDIDRQRQPGTLQWLAVFVAMPKHMLVEIRAFYESCHHPHLAPVLEACRAGVEYRRRF